MKDKAISAVVQIHVKNVAHSNLLLSSKHTPQKKKKSGRTIV